MDHLTWCDNIAVFWVGEAQHRRSNQNLILSRPLLQVIAITIAVTPNINPLEQTLEPRTLGTSGFVGKKMCMV